MKLVICEKNIAARRIAYILSSGKSKSTRIGQTPVYEFSMDGETWKIAGLKGHIINLDYPAGYNRWTKISPRELINIDPCKKISEKSIAFALKSLVDKNPYLIIATDFDREGELIGVEIIDFLKEYNKDITQIKRAKFSAITNYEISNAFNKLTEVNYDLSNAGKARQVIDLVWGAVLTRFISLTSHRLGKDFLSIGRVQSPTLALLVEREKEIQNFVPKTFWKIIAKLKKDEIFDAVHCEGQIWDEEHAKNIYIVPHGDQTHYCISFCDILCTYINLNLRDIKYEDIKELLKKNLQDKKISSEYISDRWLNFIVPQYPHSIKPSTHYLHPLYLL